jgi:oligogalacturonide lyase
MKVIFAGLLCLFLSHFVNAQEVLETGGKKMPAEWIDKDTHHKVVRLSAGLTGSSLSFYFHNNPFIGNEMIFYNNSKQAAAEVTDMKREEVKPGNTNNRQLYSIDLATKKTTQLTFRNSPMNGEVVSEKTKTVFYQVKDSVFALDYKTKKERLVFVFPADFKSSISAVNADGTLLGGSRATDAEKEILKNNPNKSSYFNLIYDAHLPKTLFTINVKTGQLNKIFTDSAWLNHVQFSSTDPEILSFCHEGPWHNVNRIWHINVNTKRSPRSIIAQYPWKYGGMSGLVKAGRRCGLICSNPGDKLFLLEGMTWQPGKKKNIASNVTTGVYITTLMPPKHYSPGMAAIPVRLPKLPTGSG